MGIFCINILLINFQCIEFFRLPLDPNKAIMPNTVSKPSTPPTGKSTSNITSIYESRPKVFGIGRAIPPNRNLHRFVRWPKYIRLQRQRRVMYQRLKVPPAIAQFCNVLDRTQAEALFKLMSKYRPEDKLTKKKRLLKESEIRAKDLQVEKKRPLTVKFGINHIVQLVEAKKAQIVVIAHDVDPVEIVCWLPALCIKMGIPYLIVKSKASLGRIVHKKTASALALIGVRGEDSRELAKLVEISDHKFTFGPKSKWGGGLLGPKSKARMDRLSPH